MNSVLIWYQLHAEWKGTAEDPIYSRSVNIRTAAVLETSHRLFPVTSSQNLSPEIHDSKLTLKKNMIITLMCNGNIYLALYRSKHAKLTKDKCLISL